MDHSEFISSLKSYNQEDVFSKTKTFKDHLPKIVLNDVNTFAKGVPKQLFICPAGSLHPKYAFFF